MSTDQYKIIKKLGEGGMGIVYLAKDRMLDRLVAIKELRDAALGSGAGTARRFQQEAIALAKLNHKNITHIYSWLPHKEHYWMVMEYVKGRTLEDWLQEYKRMPYEMAVAIIAQVLEGLAHAHQKGIIHRDVKPANILISEGREVKITDFGIARIRNAERLTSHGKTIGTLQYMAPEQIRGQEGDERSDIYAVGSIFYELVSGRPPFERQPDFEMMKTKLEKTPATLSSLHIPVPADLQKAILRSLKRSADKRFLSATEFKQAILKSSKEPVKRAQLTGLLRPFKDQPEKKKQNVLPVQQLSGQLRKKISDSLKAVRMNNLWPVMVLLFSLIISFLLIWRSRVGPGGELHKQAMQKKNDQYWQPAAMTGSPDSALRSELVNRITDTIQFNETPNEMLERISKKKEMIAASKTAGKKEAPVKEPEKKENPVPAAPPELGDAISGDDINKEAAVSGMERLRRHRPGRVTNGAVLTVVLREPLSSEDRSKDGKEIRLRVAGDVSDEEGVLIKKGALAIGKIVDVVPSGNRKKAVIGFVVRSVIAADGSEIRISVPRFRNYATGLNQPVYFSAGQSFTVQIRRGRAR
ncbi:hypothetical protein A8C56_10840 [Niabella ginsenosidivorans]|uniref:non-specific serine/threonine protein kinase n=2 Tax=Niabella ginsenosidivorans TaxID=1176587 RepID=A0A1A9I1K8_9BACT|nr:hypothetical protein A8C56_10840 [Niabella ginsenosidivorans]